MWGEVLLRKDEKEARIVSPPNHIYYWNSRIVVNKIYKRRRWSDLLLSERVIKEGGIVNLF